MKHIKNINEYHSSKLSEQELLEMANVGYEHTGIEGGVVIWVGPNPQQHGRRIKVSNIPNRWDLDNFTMTLPDYRIIGKVNTKFITSKIIEKIERWCELNMDAIIEYSDYKIMTATFINRLKPITD